MQDEWLFQAGETQSRGSGEGLIDIFESFFCSPFQNNGSVSGPLVASYRSLVISPNAGVQILENPAMPQKIDTKMFLCFWTYYSLFSIWR